MLKKSALFLTFALGISSAIVAQGFEGTIDFKQYTAKDTTLNTYFVKGNKVKLETVGKVSKQAEGTILVDLSAKTISMLNSSRKVYSLVTVNKNVSNNKIDTVIKLKETKKILGYTCTGYTVKSKSDNTQITYWLTAGNFNFFTPFVVLWNRKDKASVYFRQIKDTNGMLPLLSVESDMAGHEIGRLEMTKIEKKVIEPSAFNIPKDYKEYK
jgi:hypothetical protein